jgi:hypothetical protein
LRFRISLTRTGTRLPARDIIRSALLISQSTLISITLKNWRSFFFSLELYSLGMILFILIAPLVDL